MLVLEGILWEKVDELPICFVVMFQYGYIGLLQYF